MVISGTVEAGSLRPELERRKLHVFEGHAGQYIRRSERARFALILMAACFLGFVIGLFFRVPALLVATFAVVCGYGVISVIDQPTLQQGLVNLLKTVAALQIGYVAGVGISILARRRR